jgi:hypothetical protein
MKRRDAVPKHLLSEVQIPGFKHVRYRVGIDTEPMFQECAAAFRREVIDLERSGYTGGPLPVTTARLPPGSSTAGPDPAPVRNSSW